MRAKSKRLLRGLLIVLIAALTLGALFVVGVLLFGRFGEVEGKIVGSTMLLGIFSVLGMASALRIEQRRAVWLGWIGLAASAAGYVLLVAGMWTTWQDSRVFNRITVSAVVASMGCAVFSLLLLVRPSSSLVRWVMRATGVALGTLWAALETLALWIPREPDERLLRGIGAIAVLAGLGGILTPILQRMSAARRRPGGPSEAPESRARPHARSMATTGRSIDGH